MPRNPDLPCARCGTLMWRSSTSRPRGEATCRPCRVASRQHGTVVMYKSGCRCDLCRDAQRRAMRDYIAQVKGRTGVTPRQKQRNPKPRQCVDCGDALQRAQTSTPRCRRCAVDRRASKKRAATRRRQAAAKLAKAAAGQPANPRWPLVNGICDECCQPFTRRGMASPYCSTSCKRKAKKPGAWVTKRQRLAIYERDDWICQLCMEPVDPALPHHDNWSATLDHIRCRSWDEEPDHTPENLRLAHRWCNSVRGDETHYTAADLAA